MILDSDDFANDNGIDLSELKDVSDDNVIQPFQLEASNIRGRIVRLGSVVNDIVQPHDYPEIVSSLVAQTTILTALLSSMLKYDGIFTLQTKGDGPISMLVSDMTTSGDLRGCATFDQDRLQEMEKKLSKLKILKDTVGSYIEYLGKGHIAFTVDQGGHTDRYQGIVELHGISLVECAEHYFQQSEQLQTSIKIAIGQRDGGWRAGGIMLQKMPEESKHPNNDDEEDWNRSRAFLESCTDDELLNEDMHSNLLLNRLFHEEGVRVYSPKFVQKKCRCDVERVEAILLQMSEEERKYLSKDGAITMHCDFCASDYTFSCSMIDEKLAQQKKD